MTARRPPAHHDIREELRAHIDARVEDNIRRGMAPEAARAEAHRRFGNAAIVESAALRLRARRTAWPRRMAEDARQAVRTLRRRPLTAICGVVIVAIGLSTSLAGARIATALVSPPPGIERPNELMSLLETSNGTRGSRMTYAAVRAIESSGGGVPVAAWDVRDLQVIAGRDAHVWAAAVVTGGYFDALGARAAAGRLVNRDDDAAHRQVAVISDRLARVVASTPEGAVGLALTVNGRAFTVAGVTPPGFIGIEAGHPLDLWLPMSSEPDISTPTVFPDGHRVRGFVNTPGVGFLLGVARLRPGIDRIVAAERWSVALQSAGDRQADDQGHAVRVWLTDRPWLVPFTESRAVVTSSARVIGWASALILALAAACLGGLLVGRLTDRSREFGIRLALGATRAGLARLVTIDAVLIVAIGSALAWTLADACLDGAARLHVTTGIQISDLTAAGANATALMLFAGMAAAMLAAGLPGPLALVRRSTVDVQATSSRVTQSGSRFRRALLAAQVAAGCALINAALLLSASIASLQSQPLGYDAAGVVFAETDPAGAGLDAAARLQLVGRVAASGESEPGLSYADQVPYGGDSTLFARGDGSEVRAYPFGASRIGPGYFTTLGIRLLAGRDFTAADTDRHVVIISEPLARVYWPGGVALGRTLNVGGDRGVPHEIIGIVAGVRDSGLKADMAPRFYVPYTSDAEALVLVARAGSDASRGAQRLATLAREFDARLVVGRTGTLFDLARRAIEQRLLLRLVTSLVGAGSLALVAIGVWGLSQASLKRRWREFGIRQALGASRHDIVRRAYADALFVCAVGGVAGLGAGWQLGQVLESWLYGVRPHDPMAMTIGVLVVLVSAVAGAVGPARRAVRMDPTELLRAE